MNARQIDTLLVLGAGMLIGNYLTYRHMAKKYNLLVAKYNRQVEVNNIKARVFREIMPQLPDDYNLSEKSMVDIQTAIMFQDNDM
ncbi:hypothetical protein PBI_CAMILLE_31 [Microbacterium phage Camille]|nr:hypothetical protein PBI_CAMILLE_31 [Microbacterium phage Camille]